jgi:cytochrome c oxidase cbb3-type subunit IV
MIENVLHDIGGANVFGIISILIFVAFFTGMLFWAVRLKKSYLQSMRELPLDGTEANRQGGQGAGPEETHE